MRQRDRYDVIKKHKICLDKKSSNYESGKGRQFLIRWSNMGYSLCCYEFERDLILNDIEYKSHVASLEQRSEKPTRADIKKQDKKRDLEAKRLYKIFGDKISWKSETEKERRVKAYQTKLEEY